MTMPPPPPPDQEYSRGCDVPIWLKMISLVSLMACVGGAVILLGA